MVFQLMTSSEWNRAQRSGEWTLATLQEITPHRSSLVAQMGRWFICGLDGGKISGSGYGGVIERTQDTEFGHYVVKRRRNEGRNWFNRISKYSL